MCHQIRIIHKVFSLLYVSLPPPYLYGFFFYLNVPASFSHLRSKEVLSLFLFANVTIFHHESHHEYVEEGLPFSIWYHSRLKTCFASTSPLFFFVFYLLSFLILISCHHRFFNHQKMRLPWILILTLLVYITYIPVKIIKIFLFLLNSTNKTIIRGVHEESLTIEK